MNNNGTVEELDFNEDGKVNYIDSIYCLQHEAGLRE